MNEIDWNSVICVIAMLLTVLAPIVIAGIVEIIRAQRGAL